MKDLYAVFATVAVLSSTARAEDLPSITVGGDDLPAVGVAPFLSVGMQYRYPNVDGVPGMYSAVCGGGLAFAFNWLELSGQAHVIYSFTNVTVDNDGMHSSARSARPRLGRGAPVRGRSFRCRRHAVLRVRESAVFVVGTRRHVLERYALRFAHCRVRYGTRCRRQPARDQVHRHRSLRVRGSSRVPPAGDAGRQRHVVSDVWRLDQTSHLGASLRVGAPQKHVGSWISCAPNQKIT